MSVRERAFLSATGDVVENQYKAWGLVWHRRRALGSHCSVAFKCLARGILGVAKECREWELKAPHNAVFYVINFIN